MTILHEPHTHTHTAEVTLPVNLTVEVEPTGDGRIAVDVYDEDLDPTGRNPIAPALSLRVDGGHEQAADALRALAEALLRAADAEDARTIAPADRDVEPELRVRRLGSRWEWRADDGHGFTGSDIAMSEEQARAAAEKFRVDAARLRGLCEAVTATRWRVDGETLCRVDAAWMLTVAHRIHPRTVDAWLDHTSEGGH